MADLEFNTEVDHIVKECERRKTRSERARELSVEKAQLLEDLQWEIIRLRADNNILSRVFNIWTNITAKAVEAQVEKLATEKRFKDTLIPMPKDPHSSAVSKTLPDTDYHPISPPPEPISPNSNEPEGMK